MKINTFMQTHISEFGNDSEGSHWQVHSRTKAEPTKCQAKARPMSSQSQSIATSLHSHNNTQPHKHTGMLTDLRAIYAYHVVGGDSLNCQQLPVPNDIVGSSPASTHRELGRCIAECVL